MSNEFVKVRWFEHPVTGEWHQFVVMKYCEPKEKYPYIVEVKTVNAAGTFGQCVLKYSTREKRDESYATYFTEEEMHEFFNELILASDAVTGKDGKSYDWTSEKGWTHE